MKRGTKVVLISALAMILTIGFCFTASAAPRTKIVSIKEVYVNSDGDVIIVIAKPPNGVNWNFIAPVLEKNQMMALALTAVSLNKMVKLRADYNIWNDTIEFISLINDVPPAP